MAGTTRLPYEQRGIRELRALARDRKIVGFSRMPKDVLVEALRRGPRPTTATTATKASKAATASKAPRATKSSRAPAAGRAGRR